VTVPVVQVRDVRVVMRQGRVLVGMAVGLLERHARWVLVLVVLVVDVQVIVLQRLVGV
jgi:hypothetical protein